MSVKERFTKHTEGRRTRAYAKLGVCALSHGEAKGKQKGEQEGDWRTRDGAKGCRQGGQQMEGGKERHFRRRVLYGLGGAGRRRPRQFCGEAIVPGIGAGE